MTLEPERPDQSLLRSLGLDPAQFDLRGSLDDAGDEAAHLTWPGDHFIEVDPPDPPDSGRLVPKVASVGQVRAIATTPFDLDLIPLEHLVELVPFTSMFDGLSEFVGCLVTWQRFPLTAQCTKYIERSRFDALVDLRALIHPGPPTPHELQHGFSVLRYLPGGKEPSDATRRAVRPEQGALFLSMWNAGSRPVLRTLAWLEWAEVELNGRTVPGLDQALSVLRHRVLGPVGCQLVTEALQNVVEALQRHS